MVSITFFIFIGVVLIIAFFAVSWRRKNRVPLDPDATDEITTERPQRSSSAFNEPSPDNVKGGIVPADNKLSQNDFDDEIK